MQTGADSAGEDAPPPEPEVKYLQMTLEDLIDILLHCHYVTRP